MISETLVTVTGDRFGTFTYAFTHGGNPFECRDFSDMEEAFKAAAWHLALIDEGARFEVFDGIGAIYRGSALHSSLTEEETK